MAELQKVYPSMFDEVYEELLRTLDPNRTEDEWRRIFSHEWDSPEDYRGYALVDEGRFVAFLGLVFSMIPIDGSDEPFCNVSSWIAKETHRGEAATLVLALTNLRHYTLTNLSSNRTAYGAFSKLGFDVLENHVRVVLPALPFGRGRSQPSCHTTFDCEAISQRLEGSDKQAFQDHRRFAHHLLAWDDDGYCYIIYTRGRRRRLRTARVHYFSDRDRFVRHLRSIQLSLSRHDGSLVVECDERFLRGATVPWSYGRRLPLPRLFKSPRLRREQISNLYSERVLLNLS